MELLEKWILDSTAPMRCHVSNVLCLLRALAAGESFHPREMLSRKRLVRVRQCNALPALLETLPARLLRALGATFHEHCISLVLKCSRHGKAYRLHDAMRARAATAMQQ